MELKAAIIEKQFNITNVSSQGSRAITTH